MMKINLSIITINFNDFNSTRKCVKSIRDNTKDISYEIIIINNHPQSKTGDAQKLKQLYGNNSQIKVLQAENKGFGSANNLGARRAQGKFLLFLNNDTLIIDNSLKKMIDFMRSHSEVGALNPILIHADGSRQKHYFGDFQSLSSVVLRKPGGENFEKDKEFFYRQRITGAAMMLEKKFFEKLNGFDEKFFMYFEDEDLCRRSLKSNKANGILTMAKIIHLEGKSLNRIARKKIYYQSQDYYWKKHYGYFMMFLMKFLRFPYILWQKIKK